MRSSVPDFCWTLNGRGDYNDSVGVYYAIYKSAYSKFSTFRIIVEGITLEFKAPR